MKNKILEYISYARIISRENQKSFFLTLLELLYCRYFLVMAPEDYNTFSFCRKNKKEWRNYIRKREMDQLQKSVNLEEHRIVADDKFLFYQKCKKSQIPTPEIYAILGKYGDKAQRVEIFETPGQLNAFLASRKDREFIFKWKNGSYGQHILAVTFDGMKIRNLGDGRVMSCDELFNFYCQNNKVAVIQDKLKMHDSLMALAPNGALATIRVVTFIGKDGDVIVPFAFIRFPTGRNIHDNFSHGKSGNLISNIDPHTGALDEAYGKAPNGLRIIKYEHHPESNVKLKGMTLPFWREVIEIAHRAAIQFLPLRTLGWDIAITSKGVLVIETNWHYDPDVHQVAMDRGIRHESRKIFQI